MRAKRFPLELPVRYRRIGESFWVAGTTENISRSGILFNAVRPLDVDTPIEIRIAMPPLGQASPAAEVQCRARVVRIATSRTQLHAVMAAALLDFEFTAPVTPPTSH